MNYTMGSGLSDRSFDNGSVDVRQEHAYTGYDKPVQSVDTMDAARGLLIALGLSAVCWALILAVAWKLFH